MLHQNASGNSADTAGNGGDSLNDGLHFLEDGVAERYIRAYGAERMAFGTDYPLWDPVTETERFFRLRLTDEEFDQIGHKTAERFLEL